jgi:hypothetical protein
MFASCQQSPAEDKDQDYGNRGSYRHQLHHRRPQSKPGDNGSGAARQRRYRLQLGAFPQPLRGQV